CLQLCNGWVKSGIGVELLLVKAQGEFILQVDSRVHITQFNSSRALKVFLPVTRHLRSSPEVPVLVFGFHLAVGLLAAKQLGLHHSPIVYREGSSPISNI